VTERPNPQSLEAALGYLLRSWSVMAVPARTKKRTRPWKKWQRRRPTLIEVRRDFDAEAGSPNVAVICGGVSSLVVLDTDGREAEEQMTGLALPRTLSVRTARGRHWYFRATAPLRSRVLSLSGNGHIELRGEGTYVLAPPSQHPSGLHYVFEDPEAPLAELPQTILDLFPARAPASPTSDGLPTRWVQMITRWPQAQAAWSGQGAHPDKSGSGCDMFLAHFTRRLGFNRDEVREILRAAPYPMDGSRTPDYLDRTVHKAFASVGTRPRPRTGFGQMPNWIVSSGTLARLSSRAAKVLTVLVTRAERPSFIVRISMVRLVAEAKVSVDRVGKATDELAAAGVIRKQRAIGGRWNIWIRHHPPLTYSAESAEHVSDPQGARDPQEPSPAHPAPPTPQKVRSMSADPTPQKVRSMCSSVHEWRREAGPAPISGPPSGAQVEGEGPQRVAAAAAPVQPSMRLDSESVCTPQGYVRRVWRVCSDNRRVLVFCGSPDEWLIWDAPESLRFEERMAEWPTARG